MRVEEIVKEPPKLSLDEMRVVGRALQEAMEEVEDLEDVLAVPGDPGEPVPIAEIRKKYEL